MPQSQSAAQQQQQPTSISTLSLFDELCEHNAKVAYRFGKFEVFKNWMILKTLYKDIERYEPVPVPAETATSNNTTSGGLSTAAAAAAGITNPADLKLNMNMSPIVVQGETCDIGAAAKFSKYYQKYPTSN